MADKAKVMYGLSNVHYALLTETTDPITGEIVSTYGDVKAWPGAVNITLDPSGNPVIFSADNTAYYTLINNQGYEGSFETALIPDDIRLDTLGNTKDNNGFIVESDHDEVSYFALMFEINTDKNPNRYVFYKVSLSQRPSVASETVDVTSDLSVKTETVNFKAMPQTSETVINGVRRHLVKAFAGQDVDATAYNNFYTAVYTPDFDSES